MAGAGWSQASQTSVDKMAGRVFITQSRHSPSQWRTSTWAGSKNDDCLRVFGGDDSFQAQGKPDPFTDRDIKQLSRSSRQTCIGKPNVLYIFCF